MGKKIRSNLSYLRFTRGKLTQSVVAETTGLGQKTLSALETGASKGIEFNTLLKLCDFFECTPGDLLSIEEDPVSEKSKNQAKRLIAEGLKAAIDAPRRTPDEIWDEFDRIRAQMQKEVEDSATQHRKGTQYRKRAQGRN